MTIIYLDHHATTPVAPEVIEAMLPYFRTAFGNASSTHAFGRAARDAVEKARGQVAGLLNVEPREVIFTSGATEANNLALKGVLTAATPGSRLIVNAAEHKSVLDTARRLSRRGTDVVILPVDQMGCVREADLVESLVSPSGHPTALVSLMLGNNEVGTIQDVARLAERCQERNVPLHSDVTQAAGRIPLDLPVLGVGLASLSAHKMYGPKGVGALVVRRGEKRIPLEPLFDGGGHEGKLRSGTLAVPLIVGFGQACELARQRMAIDEERLLRLTTRLWQGLQARLDGLTLNGPALVGTATKGMSGQWSQRLPGNLNVAFDGVDGDSLMTNLHGIAVSSGAACSSADPEPSHVLRAMGLAEPLVKASLRFGLGRETTAEEIDLAIEEVARVVTVLRDV